RKVATRTVRRWLDAGRIPGAVKVDGKWSLPAAAIVQDPLSGVMETVRPGAGKPDTLTVPGLLASMPVMVPLAQAALILGVSEYTLRQNAGYFELQRMGDHGAYVMPKFRIRQLEG
ncbi:hypothetical protein ACFWZW_15080, partial [Microbacterium enclense]|uniref:hypothetical protein n=2 Tax=Bacillati TaxID=1783272 RepID=UPI0036DB4D67